MAIAVGNKDKRISDSLKCWITGTQEAVVGVLGPGTNLDITANWTSPFEGDSAGDKFQKTGGAIQSVTDTTSITTLNSRQVWSGNKPTTFNVELKLYALEDAQSEVMDALKALEKMAAPDVKGTLPISTRDENMLGRVPGLVTINMRGKHIYADCVLEHVSAPFDKEVGKDGSLIRATVNLQISTVTMMSRDMIR